MVLKFTILGLALHGVTAARECIDGTMPISYYDGRVSITRTGKTCMRWDSDYPHRPKPGLKLFEYKRASVGGAPFNKKSNSWAKYTF